MGDNTHPWTTEEDELLTKLWLDNLTAVEIGRQLRRTEGAVTAHACTLDLPLRKPGGPRGGAGRRYDQEDIE